MPKDILSLQYLIWLIGFAAVNGIVMWLYNRYVRPIGSRGIFAVIVLVYPLLGFLSDGFGDALDWAKVVVVGLAITLLGQDAKRDVVKPVDVESTNSDT